MREKKDERTRRLREREEEKEQERRDESERWVLRVFSLPFTMVWHFYLTLSCV